LFFFAQAKKLLKMNNQGIKYEFTAKPWLYSPTPMSWRFISLPQEMANEIRNNLKWQEEGWGRMKATAKIGNSEWKTSIWFDTKHKTYILPLKAEIRKKEKLEIGKEVAITIWI
jgi:hypothetical protein